MSKNELMKIREQLRAVYKLYDKVDDFIFTTYNYDPDFFEEYIVSYLMEIDRKINTIGELKEADSWVRNNNVNVFYDKNAMSLGSSCLTVPAFPQNIKTGVFHPKVIIIHGFLKERKREAAHIFVSSCNLTIPGYGRNKEAFACIEVQTKQVAESIVDFLSALDCPGNVIRQELKDYLWSKTSKNDSVEFIWSNHDNRNNFIDYLNKGSGDLTVISPYFDNDGPGQLLTELKNRKKTIIVPAIEGETYNIYQKDYKELLKKNVSFYQLSAGDGDDADRFVHAKLIKYGNQLFVGSYNFTSAAVYGFNTEATLVFNDSANVKFDFMPVSEKRFQSEDQKIINLDDDSIKNDIFVKVTILWEESKIQIISEGFKKNCKYSLKFGGFSDDLITDLKEFSEIELTDDLSKNFLRHKDFYIYENKTGSVCFSGLIYETGADKFRPEFCCESLDEALKEWLINIDSSDTSEKVNNRLIRDEDVETEKVLGVLQENQRDIFDNYYTVASSFESFIKLIKRAREDSLEFSPKGQRKTKKYLEKRSDWEQKKNKADQDLFCYLSKGPSSIEVMLNFIRNDYTKSDLDLVKAWLIVNYIKLALVSFPNRMRNNIYKEKLKSAKENTALLIKEIKKNINVDSKYLKWITAEFYKGNNNV